MITEQPRKKVMEAIEELTTELARQKAAIETHAGPGCFARVNVGRVMARMLELITATERHAMSISDHCAASEARHSRETSFFVTLLGSDNKFLSYPDQGKFTPIEIGTHGRFITGVFQRGKYVNGSFVPSGSGVEVKNPRFIYE